MRVRIWDGSNFSFNETSESDKTQEQVEEPVAQNDAINVPENVIEKQEDTKNNILNFEMPNLEAYKVEMPRADSAINEEVQTEAEVSNIREMPKIERPQEEVSNHVEIKNTLDALMKRGRSLTAEEIRESLAALSLTGRQVKTEEEKKEEVETEDIKQNIDIEIEKQEVTDKTLETTILSDTESPEYKTQEIDTQKIEDLARDPSQEEMQETPETAVTHGEILTNLVQEKVYSEGEDASKDLENTENGKSFEEKFDDMYAQIFGKSLNSKKREEEEKKEEEKENAEDIVDSNMNIFEESEQYKGSIPYRFIGIAFKTYIILEIEKELYILDQHAAHERIMYEKVKENYYSEEEKDSQLMLLPDIITLTHKEMDIARENMDKFQKAGFVLEEFGDNTIKLTRCSKYMLRLRYKGAIPRNIR